MNKIKSIILWILVLALAAVMPLSALAETTEADAGAPRIKQPAAFCPAFCECTSRR